MAGRSRKVSIMGDDVVVSQMAMLICGGDVMRDGVRKGTSLRFMLGA